MYLPAESPFLKNPLAGGGGGKWASSYVSACSSQRRQALAVLTQCVSIAGRVVGKHM